MVGIDEEGFETVTRRRSERVPGKFTLADMLIKPGRTTQRVTKDLRRQRDYNRYVDLGEVEADEPTFRLLQRNGNIGDPSIPTHVAEPEEVYEDGDPDDDPDFQ